MKTINFLNLLVLVCGLFLAVYFRVAGLLVFTALFMLIRQFLSKRDYESASKKNWHYFRRAAMSAFALGIILCVNQSFSTSLSLQIAEFAKKKSAFDSAIILLGMDNSDIMLWGESLNIPREDLVMARRGVLSVFNSSADPVAKYSFMTIVSFLSYLSFVTAMAMNLYAKPSPIFMGFPNKKNDDKLSMFLNSKTETYRRMFRLTFVGFSVAFLIFILGVLGNEITSSAFVLGHRSGQLHTALGAHFCLLYLLWDNVFSI